MTDAAGLFEPISIGNLTLNNRLVMAPMTRAFSPGGVPGDNVADYYRRRAEGGVGLIITEGTWIPHPSASNEDNAPRFYGEDALNGWRKVLEAVHSAGGKIMPQLWHVGLTHRPKAANIYEDIAEDFSKRLSPSGYVGVGEKVAEGMTLADGEAIIAAYAKAAATAQSIGFDGVEVHGAHGYLVDQFFWPQTNHRSDRWGGATLSARTAFGVEMIKAMRAAVGPSFPISLRFSQWKLQDFAARLAETPQELESFLAPLADAGVDIFHASQRRFWLPEFEGSDLNLAGWTKKLTGKPSITVGSIGLNKEMLETGASPTIIAGISNIDRLIEMRERGDFDLVAVGRALIADPEWPAKIRQGLLSELKPFDAGLLAELR